MEQSLVSRQKNRSGVLSKESRWEGTKPSSLFPNPKTILLAGKSLAEKKSMRVMAHALVSERAKEAEIMSGKNRCLHKLRTRHKVQGGRRCLHMVSAGAEVPS